WARAIESRRAASRLSVFGPDDCAGAAAGVGAGVGLLPPQAAATPAAVRITLKGTTRDKRVIALLSRERKKGTNMFQSPHGDGTSARDQAARRASPPNVSCRTRPDSTSSTHS